MAKNITLTTRVQNLETAQAEMDQKLDMILQLLQAKAEAPAVSSKKAEKSTKKTEKSTKKASSTQNNTFFEDVIVRKAQMSDEEKAAQKAANSESFHAWYDEKWAEWKAQADAQGLKGEARKAANKAKNAELMAEYKASKK